MKTENFIYWLQGYFELRIEDCFYEGQIGMIQKHLALVKETEGELTGFPAWLNGVLELASTPDIGIKGPALGKHIKQKLAAELTNITATKEDEEEPVKAQEPLDGKICSTSRTPSYRQGGWSSGSDRTYC